ncbi:MAG: anti-sigma F factor, partial [Firmicutes bacterium]|nr:anti-sigma F factor [Bacillota bacterium]
MDDFLRLEFPSRAQNEALARVVVAAFASRLDPTVEELAELKTAVSEAVTNAIVHGYENRLGTVWVTAFVTSDRHSVTDEDRGCGIADVIQARQPLFTSKPEREHSGLGFTLMEKFTDEVHVESTPGIGTRVSLVKVIRSRAGV